MESHKNLIKGSLIAFFLILSAIAAAQQPEIIPLPTNFVKLPEKFQVSEATRLLPEGEQAQQIAITFNNELFLFSGLALNLDAKMESNEIRFIIKPDLLVSEGYTLMMSNKTIIITGNSAHGLFNGAQSLLQLIAKSKGLSLNCWNIHDHPLYSWRGLMIDESRHFFGKVYIKSLIDWMAFYKINRFHWHLTDEPGWRIEIKHYHKLAQIGGIGNFSDSTTKTAYYMQEEINEIVSYARDRFIQVIPEIDMPGHASAANRAYPEYSGGGTQEHPEFTFNPAKDQTYTYLSTILHEVNMMFPGKLIHIGGDEVSYGREEWKNLTGIKTLMDHNRLPTLNEVENYFTRRISDSLKSWGTNVGVWDEAVAAHLPIDQATIFWWRQDHPEQLKTALDAGYQVVLCPRLPMYFDFVQLKTDHYGRKWDDGEYNSLDKVYDFPQSLSFDQSKGKIIGIQANLWTETVGSTQRADYLLFPRLAALAEDAWTSGKQKNYKAFTNRLKLDVLLYQRANIYYCAPIGQIYHPEPVTPDELTMP
ncbi:beta-N-acetylhexosaminidase [uncultured Mucilaginibacter sp.]|uniref:beta-N-acetylhexosaminidase n=1 Tax=uncultured Mucilaginibacter sp. TaxID=797541 RepID=UPI0025E0DB80|nr:beta-N-acetylhexosaminidase [uncultured Mucilaginibacter sp.]